MSHLKIGTTLERTPGSKYINSLNFAELAFQSPLPKIATLIKWRKNVKDDFKVSFIAPIEVTHSSKGAFLLDNESEQGFQWLKEALEATKAEVLVIRTPQSITPGSRSKNKLEDFFSKIHAFSSIPVVWEYSGIWEIEEAFLFAKETLNANVVLDPLLDSLPNLKEGYFRLKAIGSRNRFSEGLLYEVLDQIAISAPEKAHVVFESPRAFNEAIKLQDIINSENEF